jgi:hypothetical protein
MLDVANAAMYLSSEYRDGLDDYFDRSRGPVSWKMQEFTKYVPRQALSRFLLRAEMFQEVLHLQGSIFECGVLGGWGLMAWAQLSAIYEPLNHQRKIVGFDTFSGFPSISPEDGTHPETPTYIGALAIDSYKDIQESIKLYDMNRFLGNIPKVVLVRGDIVETAPVYLEEHPETIISLIYMDLDLYTPTKIALEQFIPRMPKGAVLAFDQLNSQGWPGETIALLDTIGIRDLRIQRFTYDTKISYIVLE